MVAWDATGGGVGGKQWTSATGTSARMGATTATKLSDKQGKDILRKWPERTKSLWRKPQKGRWWIRGQPIPTGGKPATGPRLKPHGAQSYRTQPDGLWILVQQEEGESGARFGDCVIVEVCGTVQNLNDKRSRYVVSGRGLAVHCPKLWLAAEIGVQRGGRKPRWAACGAFEHKPTTDLLLPIRDLQVLYALPDNDYDKYTADQVPMPHEWFIPHSALGTYTSPKTQEFLKRMTITSHLYR